MSSEFGLGWFFSSKKKAQRPQSRRRANRPLRVEMLESKLPLAGNITATLAGGLLTLTGDAASNAMYLQGTGGTVRVIGQGTLIGGMPIRTFTGVTNIDIFGNGGSDRVTAQGLTLAGSLFASMDSTTVGNDVVTLINVNVGNDIQILTDPVDLLGDVNSSAGADIVSLTNVTAGDDVFVITGHFGGIAGAARDTIVANRVTANNNNVDVVSDFSLLKTGNGPDSIAVAYLNINSDLFLDASPDLGNSSAADAVSISLSTIDGTLDIRTDDLFTATSRGNDVATVNGVTATALGLGTAGGNDIVTVVNSTFGTPPFGAGQFISAINTGGTGADRDTVTITKTNFYGGLNLTTGADADFVTITHSLFYGPGVVDVHTTIDLGGGNDYLNFSYNNVDDVALMELIGGAGTDLVYALFNKDLFGDPAIFPQVADIEFLYSI